MSLFRAVGRDNRYSPVNSPVEASLGNPLELHLTTSELWFGQEQEGILP